MIGSIRIHPNTHDTLQPQQLNGSSKNMNVSSAITMITTNTLTTSMTSSSKRIESTIFDSSDEEELAEHDVSGITLLQEYCSVCGGVCVKRDSYDSSVNGKMSQECESAVSCVECGVMVHVNCRSNILGRNETSRTISNWKCESCFLLKSDVKPCILCNYKNGSYARLLHSHPLVYDDDRGVGCKWVHGLCHRLSNYSATSGSCCSCCKNDASLKVMSSIVMMIYVEIYFLLSFRLNVVM